MPNNYDFLDAHGSILTGRSSVTSGSAQEPLIIISSTLLSLPVSFGAGTAVIGSIAALQGTNPWITRGSVSGTVDIGTIPGSVLAYQGTDPWRISSVYGNISGSVIAFQGGAWTPSVSGTVGASIIGQLPAGTAVLGSVMTLQGTNPWNISSVYGNISGSVISYPGTGAGSVQAVQSGTRISSVINSIPSSLLTGAYGHRNDAVASFLGGNLSWNPIATDSAGRITTKPFAAEESRIEGYASTVNVNANSVIAAAGAGLRNYITDVWVANTGAAATLVTFLSGGGVSVLGYTIAPAGGGSNLPGLFTPMRTDANATFDFRAATGTSVLYITAKGFKGP